MTSTCTVTFCRKCMHIICIYVVIHVHVGPTCISMCIYTYIEFPVDRFPSKSIPYLRKNIFVKRKRGDFLHTTAIYNGM